MTVTGKIDRKYMAHYIDAGSLCGGLTPKYERLENPHSSITAMKFLLTLIRSMQTLLPICSQHYRRS